MEKVATHTTRTAMSIPAWIAFGLLVVGGINWGLIGLFGINVVAVLFGEMTPIARIVYVLVGASAIYSLFALPATRRRGVPASSR